MLNLQAGFTRTRAALERKDGIDTMYYATGQFHVQPTSFSFQGSSFSLPLPSGYRRVYRAAAAASTPLPPPGPLVPRVGWSVEWTPLHQRTGCPTRHGSLQVRCSMLHLVCPGPTGTGGTVLYAFLSSVLQYTFRARHSCSYIRSVGLINTTVSKLLLLVSWRSDWAPKYDRSRRF